MKNIRQNKHEKTMKLITHHKQQQTQSNTLDRRQTLKTLSKQYESENTLLHGELNVYMHFA